MFIVLCLEFSYKEDLKAMRIFYLAYCTSFKNVIFSFLFNSKYFEICLETSSLTHMLFISG